MPLINLRIAALPNRELAARAAALVHRHTVEQLGKQPGLIAVAVGFVDPATWFVAGTLVAMFAQDEPALGEYWTFTLDPLVKFTATQ